jgi:hypothetical protein
MIPDYSIKRTGIFLPVITMFNASLHGIILIASVPVRHLNGYMANSADPLPFIGIRPEGREDRRSSSSGDIPGKNGSFSGPRSSFFEDTPHSRASRVMPRK